MTWLSLRLALREIVRRYLYARASSTVLVIGDSHVRVFEHWWFLKALPRTRFEVVYVPGATAGGIGNPKSQTGAYRIFQEALSTRQFDLVLAQLGEVDTAYSLWKRAEAQNKDAHELVSEAVARYCAYLGQIHAAHPLAVMSACLPTLSDQASPKDEVSAVRAQVKASQKDRTELALAFNKEVQAFCARHGIPFLSADESALGPDGVVRANWTNAPRYDHHYARAPYARWLAQALKAMKHPSGLRLC